MMTRQMMICSVVAAALFGWISWTAIGGKFDRYIDFKYQIVPLKLLGSLVGNSPDLTDQSLPEKVCRLNGRKVAIEGFIFGGISESGDTHPAHVRRFTLMYDVSSSFAGNRGPTEKVFGTLSPGVKVDAEDLSREVRVLGTFHVGVQRDTETGKVDSIFRIDVDRLEGI